MKKALIKIGYNSTNLVVPVDALALLADAELVHISGYPETLRKSDEQISIELIDDTKILAQEPPASDVGTAVDAEMPPVVVVEGAPSTGDVDSPF